MALNDDDDDEFSYDDYDLGEEDNDYDGDYDYDFNDGYDDEPDNEDDSDNGNDGDEDSENDESDEEEGEEESVEEATEVAKTIENQAKKQATKAATEHAKKAAIKTVVTNPYFWVAVGIVLAVILIIALIFMIASASEAMAAAPYENVDVSNGVFDTADGIMGDKFYGARFIYRDDEKAVSELEKYYEALSVDFLEKLDSEEGIDLTFTLDYSERPEQVLNMMKIIANSSDTSANDLELADSLKAVDHFGWTKNELELIKSGFENYLTTSENVFVINEEVYQKDALNSDIRTIFDNNYSSLNVTCPLYFVDDVILNSNSAMITGLPKRNYVAMIYLPKETVHFEDCSYMFYLQDSETEYIYCDIEFHNVQNGNDSTLYTGRADSTWWDEDSSTHEAEVDLDAIVPPSSSIDANNLEALKDMSIYSALLSESGLTPSLEIANLYFKTEEISDEDNYTNINFLPKESSYIYLTFNCNLPFQFCELSVSYS